MMSTIGLVYISGVLISLILILLIYSYYSNHEEQKETIELEGFGCLPLLSWVTVVFVVVKYNKQIKEMLSFKRNDDTTI